jgi:hypothetical protein
LKNQSTALIRELKVDRPVTEKKMPRVDRRRDSHRPME